MLSQSLLLVIFAAIMAVGAAIIISRRRNERQRYEFITIIAHKFRTPLTHIKWATDTLVENAADPYTKQSLLDIQTSNENLIRLTGTLIELTDSAKISKSMYKLERLPLYDLIAAAAAEAKTAFHEKNMFIGVQCADPELAIKADLAHMRFVLDTLLENACLYSPPGRNIEIVAGRHGGKAIIAVTDHGIGIEPRDASRIFSKFFRAKNAQAMNTEGFGVGLFLAQSIARRHGGHIKAFSNGPDTGSTFSLVLPRVK